MISAWMLYATGTALLLGGAAWALERVRLGRERSVRWVWVVALAGSLCVPAAAMGTALLRGESAAPGVVIETEAIRVVAGVAPVEAAGGWRLRLERALGIGWLAVLERRQRRWRPQRVGGRMVLVSEDTGPAVVRFLWTLIVVPRWVLELDEAAQRRLIAHEEEHERAGDPWLLLLGAAALVLMPWNLALWWQVRRLRLAIEVDCDARVLRALPGARAYGLLLLDAGRRASRVRIPTAAFSEPPSLLERRIRILTRSLPPLPRRALGALGALAVLAPVSVAALPVPEPPRLEMLYAADLPWAPAAGATRSAEASGVAPEASSPDALPPIRLRLPAGTATGAVAGSRGVPVALWTAREPAAAAPVPTPLDLPPRLRNRHELARLVEEGYPGAPPGTPEAGTVLLWAHIDAAGRVVETRTARSSGREELDRWAQEILRRALFVPPRRHERPVDAWIQIPITLQPHPAE